MTTGERGIARSCPDCGNYIRMPVDDDGWPLPTPSGSYPCDHCGGEGFAAPVELTDAPILGPYARGFLHGVTLLLLVMGLSTLAGIACGFLGR